MVLGEESEGKEGYLGRDLPSGASSSSRSWGIPVLGSYREDESPDWLGGGWTTRGSGETWSGIWVGQKQPSLTLTQGAHQGSPEPWRQSTHTIHRAKSPRGPNCPTAGQKTQKLVGGVGSDQLWETRETWTWDCVPWERVTIAGTWQAVWRRQLKPLSAADTSKGPPCFIITPRPHSGGSIPMLGQGEHALKGNGVRSVLTLWASAPATWDRLCPGRAGMAPEQRGDPTSHWLQF